jgi:hypothetical protein
MTEHRLLTGTVLLFLTVGVAAGGDFTLDWWTIAGGGDTWTTGGNFELSGTIGQPAVGAAMTGGDFALTSGFWSGVVAGPTPGDLNCDGAVNFDDINPFVLALGDPAGYHVAYPNCDILAADCDFDGDVDFDDINSFVALLTGG